MIYNRETKMYEGFIYIILNDIDPEQVYIGQTTCTPEVRWNAHCSSIKKHISTEKLHNKMASYGKEHFAMEVLEHHKLPTKELLYDRLDEREIALIALFDSYYNGLNSTKGGRSGKENQMRPLLRFDLDRNFIGEYESVDSMKKEIDNVCSIYDCCNHNTKYAYGSLWKYKDDDMPLPVLTDIEKQEAHRRYMAILPIKKYDYKGDLLCIYKNINDVLKHETDINRKQLMKSCTGEVAFAGKHIYRFECDDFLKYTTYSSKMRIVEQYDTENNLLNVYYGTREAERQTGIAFSTIGYYCRSDNGLYNGFIWRYGDIVN